VLVVGARAVAYVCVDNRFFGNGWVSLLYVAPAHRRRGYGEALLRHAERLCREPKLFTSTNASNTPMHALLHKLGYVRSGTIDNLDEGDPEWVFVKRMKGE